VSMLVAEWVGWIVLGARSPGARGAPSREGGCGVVEMRFTKPIRDLSGGR